MILAAIRPGPLTVAVLLGAFTVWRWRRLGVENKVLAVLATAGFAVYATGLVHPPSLDKIVLDVGKALGPYTYILVGVMAFLETGAFVGLVAPGETVVIVGGLVAGQGEIDIVVLIGLVWVCAVLGDTASFLLGRRLGREFLVKHGPRLRITEPRLKQVEGFLHRHGGPTILFGRFIGLVRAIAPFVAGASRLPLSRFLPYDIVAAGAWATTFSLLGFIFWRSFDQVVNIAKKGALAFATIAALVVGAVIAYRYLRVPENRATTARWLDRHVSVWRRLEPVGRRMVPFLRFLWNRVTPGQLGLELTTLLAIGSVGSYVFFGLGSLTEDRRALGPDTTAFDFVSSIEMGWLDDVVKAFTWLGSRGAVFTAVFVAVVFLASRGRWSVGVQLVAGMVLTVIGVHVAKAATDRVRPSDSLVSTDGSSFPSGHAAYAVAYVAIAVAVAYAFPRLLHRAAVIGVAIGLAALIGLSRVYLRAHYLSDVLAGWGLGAAVFALCGLVGLIVAFVRHNDEALR